MHIYLKNIPAKFHPDLNWNDGVLRLFRQRSPQQEECEEEQDSSYYVFY